MPRIKSKTINKSESPSEVAAAVRHCFREWFPEAQADRYASAFMAVQSWNAESLCAVTPEFVAKNVKLPRNEASEQRLNIAPLARRAGNDLLTGFAHDTPSGERNSSGALGAPAPSAGATVPPTGVHAAPKGSKRVTAGAWTAQPRARAAPGVNTTAAVPAEVMVAGSDRILAALRRRTRQNAVQGYELHWQSAATTALTVLESELKVQDICAFHDGLCSAGQELLLRELGRKTAGILGHRKRKLKIKK